MMIIPLYMEEPKRKNAHVRRTSRRIRSDRGHWLPLTELASTADRAEIPRSLVLGGLQRAGVGGLH